MTLATQIIARLNADDTRDYGLSNADATLTAPDTITFTYPAPVLSGACVGTIRINEDGSLDDDAAMMIHADFDAFNAELESLMIEEV